jgi:hypothetical protein
VNRKNNYGNQENKCHDSVDAIGRIQNTSAESRLPTAAVLLIVCQTATMNVPQAISQNGNCFRSQEHIKNDWLQYQTGSLFYFQSEFGGITFL